MLEIQNVYLMFFQQNSMANNVPPALIKSKLTEQGYSEEMIKELWKWYDPSGKEGVASF